MNDILNKKLDYIVNNNPLRTPIRTIYKYNLTDSLKPLVDKYEYVRIDNW